MDIPRHPTTGVHLALPRELPAVVVKAFAPFFAPSCDSADVFPALLHCSLAVEHVTPDTANNEPLIGSPETRVRAKSDTRCSFAALRAILVNSRQLVIGDATSGATVMSVALPQGVRGVSVPADSSDTLVIHATSSIDESWKSAALTFPRKEDRSRFLEALDAVFENVSGSALEASQVPSVEEAMRTVDSPRRAHAAAATGAGPIMTLEQWPSVNMTLPTVSDRMTLVKAMFADVDESTKAVALRMEEDGRARGERHGALASKLVAELTDTAGRIEAEAQRARYLDRLDHKCRELIDEVDTKRREHTTVRLSCSAEIERWQTVLGQRQTDELHVKRRATRLQSSDRQAIDALEAECNEFRRRIDDTEQAVMKYNDDVYADAERRRDDAAAALAAASDDLQAVRQQTSKTQSRALAAAVEETLAENAALRKLLQSAERDCSKHATKRNHANELAEAQRASIAALSDDAKIAEASASCEAERLKLIEGALVAAEAELCPLRDRVAALESKRRFFLASKAKHSVAALRRTESERSHSALRSTHAAQSVELLLGNVQKDLRLRLSGQPFSA